MSPQEGLRYLHPNWEQDGDLLQPDSRLSRILQYSSSVTTKGWHAKMNNCGVWRNLYFQYWQYIDEYGLCLSKISKRHTSAASLLAKAKLQLSPWQWGDATLIPKRGCQMVGCQIKWPFYLQNTSGRYKWTLAACEVSKHIILGMLNIPASTSSQTYKKNFTNCYWILIPHKP